MRQRFRSKPIAFALPGAILLLVASLFVPKSQLRAVADFGGYLDAEHADYFSDDTFATNVGYERWGCGGGHAQSGTITDYVHDVNWSCRDYQINHDLCFYGYVEYWYEDPPDSNNWMPYWLISGYYNTCGF